MAHKLTPEFLIIPWADLTSVASLRSAFRKKGCWVVDSPASRPFWYATVLSNLAGRYVDPEEGTIDIVRSILAQGLHRTAFERLKALTSISGEELGRVVGIPMRTLARREQFKPDESERILRVASVFHRTIEVLGDLEKARRWFATPKRALGGRTPLEFCDTEPGAEEVRDLLGRLEHGVFT